MNGFFKTRNLAMMAVFTAVACVLALPVFHVHVPNAGFLIEMEFSDLPVLLCAYYMSPLAGVVVAGLKSVIRISFTETGGIGELLTFFQGVCAVLPMFFFARRRRKADFFAKLGIGAALTLAYDLLIGRFVMMPVAGITDPYALWYLILPFFAARFAILYLFAAILATAMHGFLLAEFGVPHGRKPRHDAPSENHPPKRGGKP